MELKEFITRTLTQIADGVGDAIDASAGKGYLVNPSVGKVGATYAVHFDVIVESSSDGKAGIKILNGSISEKSVNRLTFDVNMTFPTSGNANGAIKPA